MLARMAVKSGVLVSVCLMLAMGLFVFIPGEAEAAFSPTVTVGLDQAEMTAYVAPGQKGVVTFSGTVHCVMPVDPGVQRVVVNLEAEAGGWAWSITPSTMAFDRQVKDGTFSLSVRVPPRTSHMITQQLDVSGRWTNQPGMLSGPVFPAHAMINVDQFYKFQLECKKPMMEGSPGDQFIFTLSIRNEGNDQDTIKVMLDPLTEKRLTEMNWAVMLSQTEYILDPGSQENVRITVKAAEEWNVWKNEVQTIKVRVLSYQALTLGEIPVETEYAMYIREKGWSAPGYEVYLAVLLLIPAALMTSFLSARSVARARRRRRYRAV